MDLPQTEEARTEASQLMAVHQNLVTPRNGEPLVAPSQDFLLGCVLVDAARSILHKGPIRQLVSYFGDAEEHIDIPIPAILKPVPLWTCKQVFSTMLRPNKDSQALCSFETKEKNYAFSLVSEALLSK